MLREWSFIFNQEVILKKHSDSNKLYKWIITFCPFNGKIHGFRFFFVNDLPAASVASLPKHVALSVSVSWDVIFNCGYQIQNPTTSIVEDTTWPNIGLWQINF